MHNHSNPSYTLHSNPSYTLHSNPPYTLHSNQFPFKYKPPSAEALGGNNTMIWSCMSVSWTAADAKSSLPFAIQWDVQQSTMQLSGCGITTRHYKCTISYTVQITQWCGTVFVSVRVSWEAQAGLLQCCQELSLCMQWVGVPLHGITATINWLTE